MGGGGENASIMYTSLHGQQEIYRYFEKEIIWATKPWLISTVLNIVFELDRQKVKNLKERENTIVLREIQGFGLQFTSPVTGVFCSHLFATSPGTKAWNGLQFIAFFSNFHVLKTWFELLRIKLYRNNLKGNKNYVELAGGSSYWGQNYSKWKKEIQGKSILVQVSARFELVRVWVIGSWLYM